MKKVKIMTIAAITSVAMLMGLTGCQNASSSSDSNSSTSATAGVHGIVSGIVTESIKANTDADTDGKKGTDVCPVAGATVEMGQYHTKTNDSGVWVIDNVIPNSVDSSGTVTGSYTAVITKDGYVPTTISGIQVNPAEYKTADPFDEKALIDELNATAKSLGLSTGTTDSTTSLTYVVLGDGSSGTASSYIDISTIPTTLTQYVYKYSVTTEISVMCPLSAGINGTLEITSATGADSNTSITTTAPAGKEVYFTYGTTPNIYTFGPATTNDKGEFSLISGLPDGQTVTVSIPGFNASIKIDDTTTKEYYFDSNKAVGSLAITLANTKNTSTTLNDPIILYAQPTKIVVTKHNVGIDSVVTPLALTAPVTFTFDRPMASLTAAFTSGDKNSVSWDSTFTTATITPLTLSGKWTKGVSTISLTGEAKDGTKSFACAGPYNVSFITFEFTKVEIVDSIPTAARAVSTEGKAYLAITFNENVDTDTTKTFLKFGENTSACTVTDNVVYVPFGDAVNTENNGASLTGQVTSVSGGILSSDNNDWSGIDSYYNIPSYKITAVSWYSKADAVNTNNDNTVKNPARTDAITITFGKAFDSADIATAELYNTAPGSNSFTNYSYKNTAAVSADGLSITITPAAALEAGKKYYVALKVTDSTKASTKFTTANYNFYTDLNNASLADTSVVYGAPDPSDPSDPTKTIPPYYLTFTTKANPAIVYAADDVNTKTTTEKNGYALALNDPLVLQFDQDVTGYKFYIAKVTGFTTTNTIGGYDKDVVSNASSIIGSTTAVDGKIVTITPDTYYISGSSVYAYVYDTDGKYITKSDEFTVKDDLQTVLADAVSAGKIQMSLKTPSKIDSTSPLTFIITPVLQSDGACPTYTIYKAVMKSTGKYGDWAPTTASGTPSAYNNVKRGDEFTLSVNGEDSDYDWGTPKYIAEASVNNLTYASSEFSATDTVAPLYALPESSDGSISATSFDTDAKATYALADKGAAKSYKINFTAPNTNGNPVHLATGSVSGVFNTTTNIPTVTGAFKDDSTYEVTLTVPSGGTLTTNDKLTITLKDTSGNTATAHDASTVTKVTVTIQ